MNIGPLHSADLDAALALSTAEGWNQAAADWSRMLRLEPAGCFAARDGSRLVGTVTTTTYGRGLAWIGMMVVHPECRRQGIGAALMRRALDHLHGLGVASIMLDATPAGRPLYESLGFTAEAEMERWQGVVRPVETRERVDIPPGPVPRRSNDESWRMLTALDRAAYGVDRSRLLELLVAEGVGEPLLVESADGPVGYTLARRVRTAVYLGPLVASNRVTARQLLDGMLMRFAEEEVGLDLHRGGLLEPAAVAEWGLAKRRVLTRMRHGPRGGGATAPSICASAGPQFG